MAYVQRVVDFAYYNEIDPYAADWLENLIRLGEIPSGFVDRRSIEDVRPDDLRGFRQCHFFAGIGVWAYSFRRIGWPDDAPVWTGSCPCQPFSAAGKGGGVDDPRHLWPAWSHLIRECCPPKVYGEQVASADGVAWLDLVCADMEGEGYAIGAVDTPSAGHGAPHIRQRLRFYAFPDRSGQEWMGHGVGPRLEGHRGHGDLSGQPGWVRADPTGSTAEAGPACGLADSIGSSLWGEPGTGNGASGAVVGEARQRQRSGHDACPDFTACGLDDPDSPRHEGDGLQPIFDDRERRGQDQCASGSGAVDAMGRSGRPSPTSGFWRDPDWLFCRDGRWRPVEPGSFPLVDGATFRVGSGSPFEGKSRAEMLRCYGNAIDAEATVAFIESTLVTLDDLGADRLNRTRTDDLLVYCLLA